MPHPHRLWTDLGCFLIAVALAIIYQWEARDVIWGLWGSSLVVGYITILVDIGQ